MQQLRSLDVHQEDSLCESLDIVKFTYIWSKAQTHVVCLHVAPENLLLEPLVPQLLDTLLGCFSNRAQILYWFT